jgi:protocatechuate 3,4-dioxygenase alpha subunit
MSGITPSQTVGPYFKYGLTPGSDYQWNDAFGNDLVTPDASGERIRIVGRVFDGDGKAITDSMLEIWQADAQGRFADPQDARSLPNAAFRGFGRCGTDSNGEYSFHTIKPGPVSGPNEPQAPHILLAVFARGMTRQAHTRIVGANLRTLESRRSRTHRKRSRNAPFSFDGYSQAAARAFYKP